MPVPEVRPPLGRDDELAAVARVAGAPEGVVGLALVGEPGAGTTTLLREGARDAIESGVRVLVLTPVPARAARPLAALRELAATLGAPFAPLGPDVDRDERDARVATLLRDAARDRPTVLLLDGVAWVDDASWDALTLAARALRAEPFALLAAGGPADARVRRSGLDVVRLDPLGPSAASALVAAVAPGLPVGLRARTLEAAGGNPLALRELATASRDAWSRCSTRPHGAVPLSPRLVDAFDPAPRVRDELEAAVVLAAAAADRAELGDAVAVAARVTGRDEAAALAACSALAARGLLVAEDETVGFRTEVARAVAYRAASLPRRHAVHVAFAAVVATEPDRAAWHRSAASLRRDPDLAATLAEGATAARLRGGLRDALATMERAARVSPPGDDRVARLLEAAAMAFEIGRPDLVDRLVSEAVHAATTPAHRERIGWIQAVYDLGRPDDGRGALAFARHAEAAATGPDAPWRDDWVRALAIRVGERAASTPPAALPADALRAAVARMGGMERHPALAGVLATVAPAEHGAAVLAHLRALPADAGGDPRLGRHLGQTAHELGDDRLAIASLTAAADRMRLEGRWGMLPVALMQRGWASYGTGELTRARADADAAARLAQDTGQDVLRAQAGALQALVEGIAGDPVAADARAAAAERALVGRTGHLADAHVARGIIALWSGRWDDAADWFARLWAPDGAAALESRRWLVIGDYAEAAAAAGRADEVRPHVAALARTAAAVDAPRLRRGVAVARAALADDDAAADAFVAAARAAAPLGPLAAARVHLGHGMWLRRHRRIVEARRELRAARDGFEALGAAAARRRAEQELRAAGTAAPRSATGPRFDELTAQELQIAEMAASGLSNREIGARLFLSHRTIGSHLYRVFPKLGVSSRAQLRDALTALAAEGRQPV
ncbi:LuxR family transcriptional regulator [Patulibacter sp. SYSU D01012]|uniref:helix-turn-helix transcriptional regulator n=1 Tax=Patulibacter sp. SYSU D01012 TaxID=2817381 RepID=UPI001B31165D|nr:LuxR family transcriptional regulator [Patulibacter sp. SYSU D01012]